MENVRNVRNIIIKEARKQVAGSENGEKRI